MATLKSTIDYILEQISAAGDVSAKKMFGEYALYCNTKVVDLVCDDELFVKPTKAGQAFLEKTIENSPQDDGVNSVANFLKSPYPKAKPYFIIDNIDDREWLSTLIKISAEELPFPKKKTRPNKLQKVSLEP